METTAASGLDHVTVAHTALSDVDGERGRLVIRGYAVETLAKRAAFEDACALMWNGVWPTQAERRKVQGLLGQARVNAFAMVPSLGAALRLSDGMDALRAAVAHLSASGAASDRERLTGAVAVFASAWARVREGQPPVPPDSSRSQAADCLAMLTGAEPDAVAVRALDAYWTCVIDHGMNASTFAARVVASTGSDTVSAIVAAIGALKRPLHGGAPGPVLDMLDSISRAERAPAWLEAELAAGRRIMGMGHRLYRVRDPRVAALETAISALEVTGPSAERLALARAVEREAERLLRARHPERPLRANVEFYTAVLLEAIGIPRALFAPMFAASRVAGWCAHVEEQRHVGRFIRPASVYVGPRSDSVAATTAS